MSQVTNVVPFRAPDRSYRAKAFNVETDDGFVFGMSGTLEGSIDFFVRSSEGSLTYPLTTNDAHRIIVALHAVVADIQENCLFDADPLLSDSRT